MAALAYSISFSAFAACDILAKDLSNKMKDYKAFREKNEEALKALASAELACKQRGATVSAKLASLAESLSCEAQLDASGMDKELAEIGETCQSQFQRAWEIQATVHGAFNELQGDLLVNVSDMKKSEILNAKCKPEISQAEEMVGGFLKLEESIIGVQMRSLEGKVDYGKFSNTARSLQKLTATRGKGCGELTSAIGAITSKPLAGGMAPVPQGKSPRDSSDVTGRTHADELEIPGKSAGIDYTGEARSQSERRGETSASSVTAGPTGYQAPSSRLRSLTENPTVNITRAPSSVVSEDAARSFIKSHYEGTFNAGSRNGQSEDSTASASSSNLETVVASVPLEAAKDNEPGLSKSGVTLVAMENSPEASSAKMSNLESTSLDLFARVKKAYRRTESRLH